MLQSIRKYRKKEEGLPDLLNWAALIDDGIVLNKSGALMAGYYYLGKDMASSTDEERNYITERVNIALSRLGNGWVTWHDAIRLTASEYPAEERSHFPDKISKRIDDERRQQFLSEGSHFESEYVLILLFTPPISKKTRLGEMMWSDEGDKVKRNTADKMLETFKTALAEIENTLSAVIRLKRMGSYTFTDSYGNQHLQDELVNYLKYCLTGNINPINIPPHGMYMDAYIGGKELWVGDTPKIDDQYICCVAIEGFPNESYPNILDVLERLPVSYRWSTRMIYLDRHTALKELESYRRKWKQKIYSFTAQVLKKQGDVNEDALNMTAEAKSAITQASSEQVTYGYYTPVIVLMGENRGELLGSAKLVKQSIEKLNFICRIETVNALEAWLGSLPGHPSQNVRVPLIHTLQQADLLPLSSVWAGLDLNPCSFYSPYSPPLAYTATLGSTPFRLNLHVGDVGHTLIIGPTGAGKSTLLCFIAAQFRRYAKSSICVFDKGHSMWALANACGGKYYDIGSTQNSLMLSPLSVLENEGDLLWAEEWIEICYTLQSGKSPSPAQRERIHYAVQLLQKASTKSTSLTDFLLTVQDLEIRAALSHYTIDGALGCLLDGYEDSLEESGFSVFEMEELMGMGDKNLIPVLLYLFRRFEKSLNGQPALLLLGESWSLLQHSVFRAKIKEWLKTLRKKNCAVVLETTSLSDTVSSGIFDVLLESCRTKIFLPNHEADKEGSREHPGPRDFYAMTGLNGRQIDTIKNAIPKRHYYYMSPEGNRLFDLGLGPVALSFIGVSDKNTVSYLQSLKEQFQENWPEVWLKERGISHA